MFAMATKFQNLREYLSTVEDEKSILRPIYLRNFRELLRLIPFVGSFIEANTVGAFVDRKLERRLRELEQLCESALRTTDATYRVEQVTSINQMLFPILIAYQEYFAKANPRLTTVRLTIHGRAATDCSSMA